MIDTLTLFPEDLHPWRCGPCGPCIEWIWSPGNERLKAEYIRRETADACRAYLARTGPPPTRDQLLRHAERFGSESVMETAAELGVDLRRLPAPRPPRQRRTGAGLREQAAELHRRGMVPAAIADALNVSDRRARQLLQV